MKKVLILAIAVSACQSTLPSEPLPDTSPYFYAKRVPTNTPIVFSVCQPHRKDVQVFVDSYLLGSLGWNSKAQCMQLVSPGLSGHGKRKIYFIEGDTLLSESDIVIELSTHLDKEF